MKRPIMPRAPKRPRLTRKLNAQEFGAWYWLKTELVDYCRSHKLPVSGAKTVVAARVADHLSGVATESAVPGKRNGAKHTTMPTEFKLKTKISPGWRCSQALRRFFQEHCGKGFRFNGPLRDFVANEHGKTLQQALAHYRNSLQAPKQKIAKQFEYNNHMRAFHKANPTASHQDAVAAWWQKRGR